MDKEQDQELIANSQGPIDQDGEPVNPRFYTSAAAQISAPSPNLLCRVGDNYDDINLKTLIPLISRYRLLFLQELQKFEDVSRKTFPTRQILKDMFLLRDDFYKRHKNGFPPK